MDIHQFEERKREHIRYALDPKNQAPDSGRLDRIHLFHEAMPDLNFEEVGLESVCLGKVSKTPFYVAAITSGHPDAMKLNRTLARCCDARGWALGLGSLRRELTGEEPDLLKSLKELRMEFPRLPLYGNLGLSQLSSVSAERVRDVFNYVGFQALAIHTNPLQESLQPEGTPRFRDSLSWLKSFCRELRTPVVLKETGCGFSKKTVERLRGLDLAALDVSGVGGTHWGRIEGARSADSDVRAAAARTFANWGETTVDSLLSAKECRPRFELWASGGVRSGLTAAKLLALGAVQIGYAQPVLAHALESEAALLKWMEQQEFELKVALFCTGCKSPGELRKKEGAWVER